MKERRRTDLKSVVERSLVAERMRSASAFSLIRVFISISWLLAYAGYTRFTDWDLSPILYAIAFYAAISLILFVLCKHYIQVLKLSWYALPFVDIPIVFSIQYITLKVASFWPPELIVGFGIVEGVLIVCVAQLSMQSKNVILAASISAALSVLLLYSIDYIHGWPSSLVTFATAAAILVYLPKRTKVLMEKSLENSLLRKKLEDEIELASEIQKNLLPKTSSDDFPVHGINIPYHKVSGDFYDHLTLSDNRIYFCLGDVSGKGLEAAMLMAKTCSLFHHLCKSISSPSRLLELINTELTENLYKGMFVTMVAGFIDPDRKEIVLANAGHLPAVLHSEDGQIDLFQASSPPLGILPNLQVDNIEFPARNGDRLYLFTDGLIEAEDEQGHQYGIDGVIDIIRLQQSGSVNSRTRYILDTILSNAPEVIDDVTILTVDCSQSQ